MKTFDEALAYLLSKASPTTKTEEICITHALGRILAKNITASLNVPPHHNSMMDGYAVRLADTTETGSELRVTGEIPAGTLPAHAIGPGEAMRIFTGAPVPPGADGVVIQENTLIPGSSVTAVDVFHTDMAANGDWCARGDDPSSNDWAVRNNVVVAVTGDAITSVSAETWGDAFGAFTGHDLPATQPDLWRPARIG